MCVYRSERRSGGVQWDARNRAALGEGKDPVNMEDANIGLGKCVGVCLRDRGELSLRPSKESVSARSPRYQNVACIAKA